MPASTTPAEIAHAPAPGEALPPDRPAPDSSPGGATRSPWKNPRWWAAVEFLGLVAFQAFHQVEHTLEVFEKRLGQEQVMPLLGGVDFEWAHFFGNTLLFACSVAVVVGYGRKGRARWRETSRLAFGVFMAGIAVQSTHVVEHVVRVVQYVSGSKVPPGLATKWLDPVWFHWGINMVFFAGLLAGFFGLRVYRDLLGQPMTRRAAPPLRAVETEGPGRP